MYFYGCCVTVGDESGQAQRNIFFNIKMTSSTVITSNICIYCKSAQNLNVCLIRNSLCSVVNQRNRFISFDILFNVPAKKKNCVDTVSIVITQRDGYNQLWSKRVGAAIASDDDSRVATVAAPRDFTITLDAPI